VRLTLAASTISCWAVSVGLSFVFSVICGWGLVGIWLAFLLDEFVRAVFYIFIWYFTLCKSKQTEPAL
jgi:Na+-driven multidrug efflux pump